MLPIKRINSRAGGQIIRRPVAIEIYEHASIGFWAYTGVNIFCPIREQALNQ